MEHACFLLLQIRVFKLQDRRFELNIKNNFLFIRAVQQVVPKGYQHIVALAFAVKEINEDPHILPNITLGFRLYDSYSNARSTYLATLLLLSMVKKFVPNYICDVESYLAGVIGGLDSEISFYAATVLDIFKIPQLIYGSAPVMNDKSPGLPFYQMAASEALQYEGILSLLLHFRWTWIGVIATDNENGERFVQTISPMFTNSGVCFAFIERIPDFSFISEMYGLLERAANIQDKIFSSKANVVVTSGESYSMANFRWLPYLSKRDDLINNVKSKVWIITAQVEFASFVFQRNWDSGVFNGAIAFEIHFRNPPGFHQYVVHRNPSSTDGDGFIRDFWQQAFGCVFPDITTDKVEGNICTGEEKLENLPGSFFEMSMTGHSYSIHCAVYAMAHALHAINPKDQVKKHKLHHFLRSISFNNTAGDVVFINQNGEAASSLDIVNWIIFPNQSLHRVRVGRIDPQAPPDQKLTLDEDAITWHRWFNQPLSVCTERCLPGSSKKVKEGQPPCCYDCIPCPEGKIANQDGKEKNLIKWVHLIERCQEVKFQKKIEVIICVSLPHCPSDIGGSSSSNNNLYSLATSPPYPDVDMYSMTEEIILECNEGSVTMFYCVLIYMSCLATVSFAVAFLARKLPDSFNEAKFITFSMLVFCSVWLSFIPSYLSTKGKYMVAVEIFSILASGGGLLGCIFSPKCYIIILKPELNNREQLIRKKN
uniref:G-protein coupled receptors family 3 profile domain-containing protein n=1 Tax=Podarcis muralis TaxID=64176 RepID=A0A670J6P3_PODMU